MKDPDYSWDKTDVNFLAFPLGLNFPHNSVYSGMIRVIIDRLNDAGILSFIFEYFEDKKKMSKSAPKREFLKLNELKIWFYIYLGISGISIVTFAIESLLGLKICRTNLNFKLLWMKFKFRKQAFAKVRPILIQKTSSNWLKSFKIKIKKPKVDQNVEIFLKVVADIHQMTQRIVDNDNSEIFGEKVDNLEDWFGDDVF